MLSRFFAVTLATAMLYAQANAQSPTVNWEAQSRSVVVTPSNAGLSQRFSIEVPQVMRWIEKVETVTWEPRTFEELGDCEGLTCSENGTGKSEAWDRYFSAPKAQKAQALNDAIKGIGQSSAEALLNAGYFNSKPRSWNAFVAEIDRAANAHVIQNSVRYEVVVKYRADNSENLGYAAGSCRPYIYQCLKLVVRNVPVSHFTDVARAKTLQTFIRDIQVTAVNPRLQSFESDTVTVTTGHELSDVRISAGPYTQYVTAVTHNGNLTNINLTGAARNFVQLPSDVVQGAYVVKSGNGVALNLSVDGRYIPAQGGTDKLQVNYVVETCPLNFLGGCGFHSFKAVDQGEVVLNSTSTVIPVKVAYKTKVRVRYTFARRGSSWYDGSNTSERTTPEFKNNN